MEELQVDDLFEAKRPGVFVNKVPLVIDSVSLGRGATLLHKKGPI